MHTFQTDFFPKNRTTMADFQFEETKYTLVRNISIPDVKLKNNEVEMRLDWFLNVENLNFNYIFDNTNIDDELTTDDDIHIIASCVPMV